MQSTKEQLEAQQKVLKAKGFYKGAIDGIWGPESIAAKARFEFDRSYAPAIPNGGLPFGNSGPYPKGMFIGERGLLSCQELLRPVEVKSAAPETPEAEVEPVKVETQQQQTQNQNQQKHHKR